MKSTKIAELKQNLSKYLKLVKNGEHVVILDRKEPVAELIPLTKKAGSARERLVAEGKIAAPSVVRSEIRITRLARKIDYLSLLNEVKSDTR